MTAPWPCFCGSWILLVLSHFSRNRGGVRRLFPDNAGHAPLRTPGLMETSFVQHLDVPRAAARARRFEKIFRSHLISFYGTQLFSKSRENSYRTCWLQRTCRLCRFAGRREHGACWVGSHGSCRASVLCGLAYFRCRRRSATLLGLAHCSVCRRLAVPMARAKGECGRT